MSLKKGSGSENRRKRPVVKLEGERLLKVEQRASSLPKSLRKAYKKSAKRLGGAIRAVKVFCICCTGFDRLAVANCQSTDCPLWAYRPFQGKKKATRKAKPKPKTTMDNIVIPDADEV